MLVSSLPFIKEILPIRSFSDLVEFRNWLSPLNVPEKTRNKVKRPEKGSASVLKTRADSGADGSGSNAFSSSKSTDAGDGQQLIKKFISSSTPMF